jgi:hypothetical protein
MSHPRFVQTMMGFIKLDSEKLSDKEYRGEIKDLQSKDWKPIFSVEDLSILVTDSIERVRLISLQTNEIVDTLIVHRMSAVLYDRQKETWTLSYVSGPDCSADALVVRLWDGDMWHECEMVNRTDSVLIPMQSSIEARIKTKTEKRKNKLLQAMFHVEFPQNQIVTCDWAMPSLKNSRWMINEILAPMAATSTVALVSSLLFPNMFPSMFAGKTRDVKSALTWSIPGWLLLDGTEIFNQLMSGTTRELCPTSVKVRDPTFWIKALATGMGPMFIKKD